MYNLSHPTGKTCKLHLPDMDRYLLHLFRQAFSLHLASKSTHSLVSALSRYLRSHSYTWHIRHLIEPPTLLRRLHLPCIILKPFGYHFMQLHCASYHTTGLEKGPRCLIRPCLQKMQTILELLVLLSEFGLKVIW